MGNINEYFEKPLVDEQYPPQPQLLHKEEERKRENNSSHKFIHCFSLNLEVPSNDKEGKDITSELLHQQVAIFLNENKDRLKEILELWDTYDNHV